MRPPVGLDLTLDVIYSDLLRGRRRADVAHLALRTQHTPLMLNVAKKLKDKNKLLIIEMSHHSKLIRTPKRHSMPINFLL